jgi:hypothetical protein
MHSIVADSGLDIMTISHVDDLCHVFDQINDGMLYFIQNTKSNLIQVNQKTKLILQFW